MAQIVEAHGAFGLDMTNGSLDVLIYKTETGSKDFYPTGMVMRVTADDGGGVNYASLQLAPNGLAAYSFEEINGRTLGRSLVYHGWDNSSDILPIPPDTEIRLTVTNPSTSITREIYLAILGFYDSQP